MLYDWVTRKCALEAAPAAPQLGVQTPGRVRRAINLLDDGSGSGDSGELRLGEETAEESAAAGSAAAGSPRTPGGGGLTPRSIKTGKKSMHFKLHVLSA
jgi:hypothetical protein